MGKSISSHRNFVLRIAKDEWFKQVFSIKKYYPGVPRRWKPNDLIFLVKRTDKGDSFVGYGVIKKFIERNKLSKAEREECEKMGWRGALVFSELYKFDPPLPIKETILGGLKVRGRCWHGYPLTDEQVNSLLKAVKKLCNIRKVD